jgi:hypothetical protein
MDNVDMIPAKEWARYKAACGKLVPELDRLTGIFADIAAGKLDARGTAYTERCVECEVEGVLEDLRNALNPNYTPPADVI